ncbi:ABC transporter ATP-binding protein [Rhizobium lusitanum]|uniref:ABC transporter ATP-binding protein n=1 Tax=Rhizobium lusitanum TaxID=293958 RepID=UPI001958A9D0|nr:ATP-binding cassette domain-containing protein [Rhizobium lusitanum]MBM7048429.1 ATP-binding cassette domain-containing protein [Rhizobium lusitanum]
MSDDTCARRFTGACPRLCRALDVASGEIVTVVGANGAGKTTLLKCLAGIQPVSSGSIVFRGETLTSVRAHARVKRGLAQSPEGRQIFTNLTVEEARALMARPSCLLLDEPSMGLAPILVAQIFDVVKGMKALGVTVLLVEQNAFSALSVADRGYVMETGRITLSGSAAELIADERIRSAYLGI